LNIKLGESEEVTLCTETLSFLFRLLVRLSLWLASLGLYGFHVLGHRHHFLRVHRHFGGEEIVFFVRDNSAEPHFELIDLHESRQLRLIVAAEYVHFLRSEFVEDLLNHGPGAAQHVARIQDEGLVAAAAEVSLHGAEESLERSHRHLRHADVNQIQDNKERLRLAW